MLCITSQILLPQVPQQWNFLYCKSSFHVLANGSLISGISNTPTVRSPSECLVHWFSLWVLGSLIAHLALATHAGSILCHSPLSCLSASLSHLDEEVFKHGSAPALGYSMYAHEVCQAFTGPCTRCFFLSRCEVTMPGRWGCCSPGAHRLAEGADKWTASRTQYERPILQ